MSTNNRIWLNATWVKSLKLCTRFFLSGPKCSKILLNFSLTSVFHAKVNFHAKIVFLVIFLWICQIDFTRVGTHPKSHDPSFLFVLTFLRRTFQKINFSRNFLAEKKTKEQKSRPSVCVRVKVRWQSFHTVTHSKSDFWRWLIGVKDTDCKNW